MSFHYLLDDPQETKDKIQYLYNNIMLTEELKEELAFALMKGDPKVVDFIHELLAIARLRESLK